MWVIQLFLFEKMAKISFYLFKPQMFSCLGFYFLKKTKRPKTKH